MIQQTRTREVPPVSARPDRRSQNTENKGSRTIERESALLLSDDPHPVTLDFVVESDIDHLLTSDAQLRSPLKVARDDEQTLAD